MDCAGLPALCFAEAGFGCESGSKLPHSIAFTNQNNTTADGA